MSENKQFANVEHKTQFSASLPESERGRILADLNKESAEITFPYSEFKLNAQEQEHVQTMLALVQSKLESTGLNEAGNLLPAMEQIHFMRDLMKSNQPHGSVSNTGTKLYIFLPRSFEVMGPEAEKIFYHEISHFVARHHIARKKSSELDAKAFGYNRNLGYIGDPKGSVRGVYEEPCAVLLAMYCNDDRSDEIGDAVDVGPYGLETSFTMAMLETYAEKKGIEPLEAFKQLNLGRARRDFTFQSRLVAEFGPEFVRALNNTIVMATDDSDVANKQWYLDLAEQGGFQDKLSGMYSDIDLNKSLQFPGIKSKLLVSFMDQAENS